MDSNVQTDEALRNDFASDDEAPPNIVIADNTEPIADNVPIIPNDEFMEEERPRFIPLPTLPMAFAQILVNVGMILVVFIVPIVCDNHGHNKDDLGVCTIPPFSLLIYSHSIHWVVHLIADQYLKFQHKKSRLNGYTEFYSKVKNVRRAPFYIGSFGNAVLLVTVTALHDVCDPDRCEDKFTKVDYLRGLITLECLIILCLIGNYIINVREFHAKALPADVYRQDFMSMVVPEGQLPPQGSIGSAPGQTTKEEILEKQAELIRYLQEHAQDLDKKITHLHHQLQQTYTQY